MQLRRGASLAWPRTQLAPNIRVPMEGVSGRCVDVELVMERQSALISGLILQSWASTQGAAAILYDWDSSQLEVCTHACMRSCAPLNTASRGMCFASVACAAPLWVLNETACLIKCRARWSANLCGCGWFLVYSQSFFVFSVFRPVWLKPTAGG